jgi:hypothetical protein
MLDRTDINLFQDQVIKTFVDEFAFNPNVEVKIQKSRVSFKKGRLNHFILFPRKGIIILHLNLRNWPNQALPSGFRNSCFNRATQYSEFEINDNLMIPEVINYLKSCIPKKQK